MTNLYGSPGIGSIVYPDAKNVIYISIDTNTIPGIVQNFQLNYSERVQPITCLNDYVHIYTFGKQPTTGNVSGFCLASNLQSLITAYEDTYRASKKGFKAFIQKANKNYECLVTDLTYSVNSESNVIAQFSMNFITIV